MFGDDSPCRFCDRLPHQLGVGGPEPATLQQLDAMKPAAMLNRQDIAIELAIEAPGATSLGAEPGRNQAVWLVQLLGQGTAAAFLGDDGGTSGEFLDRTFLPWVRRDKSLKTYAIRPDGTTTCSRG